MSFTIEKAEDSMMLMDDEIHSLVIFLDSVTDKAVAESV